MSADILAAMIMMRMRFVGYCGTLIIMRDADASEEEVEVERQFQEEAMVMMITMMTVMTMLMMVDGGIPFK